MTRAASLHDNPGHSPTQHTTPDTQGVSRPGLEAALKKLPNTPGFGMHLWRANEQSEVLGQFYGHTYGSSFRDIRQVSDGKRVAVLAETRQLDPAIPTWSHLTSKLDDEQLTASDRLVRMLHTLNHFRSGDPSDCALLIVDVNARFLSAVASNHGWAFKRVLEAIGLRAEQFVIRLSVEGIRDYATLGYVCDNYRRNGFHTALAAQDFVEAGNLTGQIRPDYLFIRPDQHWSSANISGLAVAAARFHVNVIASSITDASQVLAVKQAGIQLITE